MWLRLRYALLVAFAPPALWAQRNPSGDEEQIARLARQYLDARLANDTALMHRILAQEYASINSNGVLGDRAGALRLPTNVTPNGQQIAAFEVDSISTRLYGTTAVMIGVRRVRSTNGSLGRGLRFLFVFIRRDGRWQLVASQATDIQPRDGAPSGSVRSDRQPPAVRRGPTGSIPPEST